MTGPSSSARSGSGISISVLRLSGFSVHGFFGPRVRRLCGPGHGPRAGNKTNSVAGPTPARAPVPEPGGRCCASEAGLDNKSVVGSTFFLWSGWVLAKASRSDEDGALGTTITASA